MKEAKKGKIADEEMAPPVASISIQLSGTGELSTTLSGDTLTLLGLTDLLKDNIKARMNVKPTKGVGTAANDETAGN
jgi:hypothetical protein